LKFQKEVTVAINISFGHILSCILVYDSPWQTIWETKTVALRMQAAEFLEMVKNFLRYQTL